MGTTISQKLDTVSAAIEADVGVVSTEITKLLGELTPGATVTQAQVDRLTVIDAALKAIPPAP